MEENSKIEFTPEFIANQREVIGAATDGKWLVGKEPEVEGDEDYPGHMSGGYTGRDVYDRDLGVYVIAAFDHDGETDYEPETICQPWHETDAELIAAACNNYPAALDEIEQLRADLSASRAEIERLKALIVEADAQYNTDKKPGDFETAELSLVEMAVHGSHALDEIAWMRPEIERLNEASRWIPASEALPELIYGVPTIASDTVDVAYRYIDSTPTHYFRRECQYWAGIGFVYEHAMGKQQSFEMSGYVVDYWRYKAAMPTPPESEAE
jgi:hypothetical protein